MMSLREARVQLLDCEHRTPRRAETGYPYIAIPQVQDGRLNLDDVRCISREHFEDWTQKTRPTACDAIVSRRCNPGESAFVPPGLECALGQNLVLLRADGITVLPRFLRWLIRGPEWWQQVQRFLNVGAVFDSLKCADIPSFRLSIPPLRNQRAIAHILGTLDDKIELNRRMNETLEGMARAIFKSWFVDFDPVRAKAEGRKPPGLDPATAALFPDSFEKSKHGLIPKGWSVSGIGDVVRCVGGGTPSTKEPTYWEGGTHPFATPRDMSRLTDPVLLETARHITDVGVSKISSGQLPVGTVLLSSRAPIGYLAIAETPVSVNQGIIAMICDGLLPNHYVLQWALANMDTIIGNANGTTFLEISKRNFRPILVLVPPLGVLKEFIGQAKAIHNRVVANVKEASTLAAIRDALLPKLLSGEIRVGQAEKIAEEVA